MNVLQYLISSVKSGNNNGCRWDTGPVHWDEPVEHRGDALLDLQEPD